MYLAFLRKNKFSINSNTNCVKILNIPHVKSCTYKRGLHRNKWSILPEVPSYQEYVNPSQGGSQSIVKSSSALIGRNLFGHPLLGTHTVRVQYRAKEHNAMSTPQVRILTAGCRGQRANYQDITFSTSTTKLINKVFLLRNYRLIVALRKFLKQIFAEKRSLEGKFASFKNIKFPRATYQTDSQSET